jgi:YfiR/HmsC-like
MANDRARAIPRTADRRTACRKLLALVIAGAPFARCLAQSDLQAAEYRVKAAFLYKFASYVEWPPQVFERPETPFVFGVAGADTLGEELDQVVSGRSVAGRPVQVRKLRRGDPVEGLHILFVGGTDGGRPAEVLASAKGKPVLTVTESPDTFALGSIINFVIVDDKVRFDVALREAELCKLRVSARLLSVARKVLTGPS